ncbi:GDP-4-dehydro-6-deoxy-D-mannose reductase [Rhizobium sp. BK313]|uniref:GDP-mannose 4,6-dehydratase n=1 Tax=Rhizobium sp. BK313 TaxID=2587081 RepID=UPI001061EDBD|nr:GDP-mannose 4,6-dehydratase [Rhizobium sp. BK313]MBB3457281.1 GDP-4-dehydro-6-deoxy-D-mannose reductase [Rhizobium sp. BK313]
MPREHRLLITGANGFVGTWLQRELETRRLQDGIDLTVLTAGHGEVSGLTADVADKSQAMALVETSRPSAIIHLAAIAAPSDARKAPDRAWDVNFRGTMNLAYALMEFAPDARFIFAGSSEAYGASFIEKAGAPLDEDAALKPMGVYGATKAAADMLLGQLAYEGMKTIRFRPFNHTGPGQTDAYVVPAFAKQIAEIEAGLRPPILSVGNLSGFRDFLDARDVVRAYADAALGDLAPNVLGKAFNLSSGRPTQIRRILDLLIELSRVEVDIEIDPQRLRGSEVQTASGQNKAALAAFGWKPKFELRDTLNDVLAEWRQRVKSR